MVLTVSSELPPVSVLSLGKSLPKDLICPKDVKEDSSGVGYEVKKLPGRGSGLIATKDFYPGDLVMREHPIINMPDKVFSRDDPDYIEDWLDKRINKLSSEDRFKFYDLSDARGAQYDEDSGESSKTTLGIFYTNCMNFVDDSAALFPTMARSNHSCTPNSEFITRTKLGVQDLVATRSIKKGEEITLSYIPAADEGSDERKVRVNYLLEWYGFQCNCHTCCLKGASLKSDDALRQRIKSLQSKNSSELSLLEMDELIDGLRITESKLVYQKEILSIAIQKALAENDMKLSAKFFVSSLIVDSIIEVEEKTGHNVKYGGELTQGFKLQNVRIGHSNFLFPIAF